MLTRKAPCAICSSRRRPDSTAASWSPRHSTACSTPAQSVRRAFAASCGDPCFACQSVAPYFPPTYSAAACVRSGAAVIKEAKMPVAQTDRRAVKRELTHRLRTPEPREHAMSLCCVAISSPSLWTVMKEPASVGLGVMLQISCACTKTATGRSSSRSRSNSSTCNYACCPGR